MKVILKQNIRKILLIFALLLVIVNLIFLIGSNKGKPSEHKSAAEIIGAENADKISFCANREFFKSSLPSTMDSVEETEKEKANAVILDIYLTKDKLLVCSPFENLKDSYYLSGSISDYTYFQLLESSVAVGKQKITFSINPAVEIIKSCIEKNITAVCVFHNIKDMSLLDELFKAYQDNDSFIVYSNNYNFLLNINKSYPSMRLWYFVDEVTNEVIDSMNILREAEVIFDIKNKNNNEEMMKKLNSYSYKFGCTGVEKKSDLKKCINFGVSDIITSEFVK